MKRMRSVLTAMALLLVMFCLTACGSSSTDPSEAQTGQSAQASQSAGQTDGTAGETRREEKDSSDGETKEGVIDGMMNDMERGGEAIERGMDDLMDGTSAANEGSQAEIETQDR